MVAYKKVFLRMHVEVFADEMTCCLRLALKYWVDETGLQNVDDRPRYTEVTIDHSLYPCD